MRLIHLFFTILVQLEGFHEGRSFDKCQVEFILGEATAQGLSRSGACAVQDQRRGNFRTHDPVATRSKTGQLITHSYSVFNFIQPTTKGATDCDLQNVPDALSQISASQKRNPTIWNRGLKNRGSLDIGLRRSWEGVLTIQTKPLPIHIQTFNQLGLRNDALRSWDSRYVLRFKELLPVRSVHQEIIVLVSVAECKSLNPKQAFAPFKGMCYPIQKYKKV